MNRRFTVQEAARVLGITPEAVRGRIQRGTLPKEKGEDGTVYVRLNVDESRSNADETTAQSPPVDTALVEALKERIEHLTQIIATRDEEIRRKDHLLAAALERIPAIEEAPSEARESPETASAGKEGVETPLEEERRPWWRHFFGFG